MHHIGSRAPKGIPAFQFVIPMLDPCCFQTHEIVEINGLTPGLDPLRPAKVRNSAAGRNAGSGENQGVLRSAKVIAEDRSVIPIHNEIWIYGLAFFQPF